MAAASRAEGVALTRAPEGCRTRIRGRGQRRGGGERGWGASGRMNRSGGGFSGWGDAGGGGGVRGGGEGGWVARVARRRTLSAMRLARSFARVASLFSRRARELRHLGRRRGGHLGVVVKSSRRARLPVAWRLSSGPGKGARSTSPPEQGRGSVDGTIPAGRREKCAREVSRGALGGAWGGTISAPAPAKTSARCSRQKTEFFATPGGGCFFYRRRRWRWCTSVCRPRSSRAKFDRASRIPEDPVERPLSPTT